MGLMTRIDQKLDQALTEWQVFIMRNYGVHVPKTELSKVFAENYIPRPSKTDVRVLKLLKRIRF